MKTFIDLFCGIGGFRVALEKSGLKCVFSSDFDKDVQDVYYQNFGDRPDGDIKAVSELDIPDHDIICAGFPCQTFSSSGKQAGINDPRGLLFYEILRIAKHKKPSLMLLENVRNILHVDNGSVIRLLEKEINDIGYVLHRHTLNASFFGIPQARMRVYFVAVRKDLENDIMVDEPVKTMEKVYLEDILEKEPDERLFVVRDDIYINRQEDTIKNELKTIFIGCVNKPWQGNRIHSPKGHAITLTASGGGVGKNTGLYKTPEGVRRLSVTECKRVMGFPEDHIVGKGKIGYKQLGNAVIPPMIEHVWKNIRFVSR